MSYATSRVMSSAELAAVRADGQYTKVRAVVVPQQIVLACKCSGSLVSNDQVVDVPINTITGGAVASVKNGMTCYVGSSAGNDDLGMVRVKSATTTNLHIARISGISWDTNVFLTVVDDFGLWAKLPTLDLTTLEMDDDIQYTNQNTLMSPVPVMGPDCAVPYTSGSLALDGSNSWCPDGTAISTWAWSVINGSAASGSIVASGSGIATFIFLAPGSYVLSLVVTSTNGKSTTGRRNVYVYNDTTFAPLNQVVLKSLQATRDGGGWNAQVDIWADASLPTFRDRAKVILIASDYSNGSSVAMGQVAGREETLMVGWISDETTDYNIEFSTVHMNVKGPVFWLQKIVGPSTFLESIVGTSNAWTAMENLTMDKIIHHFLYWRSTAIEVMDVYPSSGSRIIGGMSASIGSIWSQMYDTAITRMITYLACDRFGRFIPYQDPQLLPVANRTGLTVMPLLTSDLADKVSVKRTILNPVSLLEVAGLAQSGSTVLMYMSRAPGSLIYNRFGENDLNDRLVVSSQDDANMLSGMLLAKKNNMYDSVNFTLAQNNKMLDITPTMYFTYSITAGDTIRGFTFTDKRFSPKQINYKIDEKSGKITMDLEGEGETSGIPGYTVIMPQEPAYNFPPLPPVDDINFDFPVLPEIDVPVFDFDPPDVIPEPYIYDDITCPLSAGNNGPYPVYYQHNWLYNDSPSTLVATSECKLRSGSAINKSRYEIYGDFEAWTAGSSASGSGQIGTGAYTSSDNWYNVYGVNALGQRIATGVHSAVSGSGVRRGYFAGSAAADIKYLEIALTAQPFAPDTFTYAGSGSVDGGTVYTPGTVTNGLAPGGRAWFKQVNGNWYLNEENGTGMNTKGFPMTFGASGSGVDGDYSYDNFYIYSYIKFRIKINSVLTSVPLVPEEQANPTPKPIMSTHQISNSNATAATSYYSFGARNTPLSITFEKTINFTLINTLHNTDRQFPIIFDSRIYTGGGFISPKSCELLMDEWYVEVRKAATYRMRVWSAFLYNTCEVG